MVPGAEVRLQAKEGSTYEDFFEEPVKYFRKLRGRT
jgi:hypothetical protein